jgi:hypothetical protein
MDFLLTFVLSKDEDAAGNEGGPMIDPVPRRKRRKKSSVTPLFEHVMDPAPGPPSSANTPWGTDGYNLANHDTPAEEHTFGNEGNLPPPSPIPRNTNSNTFSR